MENLSMGMALWESFECFSDGRFDGLVNGCFQEKRWNPWNLQSLEVYRFSNRISAFSKSLEKERIVVDSREDFSILPVVGRHLKEENAKLVHVEWNRRRVFPTCRREIRWDDRCFQESILKHGTAWKPHFIRVHRSPDRISSFSKRVEKELWWILIEGF